MCPRVHHVINLLRWFVTQNARQYKGASHQRWPQAVRRKRSDAGCQACAAPLALTPAVATGGAAEEAPLPGVRCAASPRASGGHRRRSGRRVTPARRRSGSESPGRRLPCCRSLGIALQAAAAQRPRPRSFLTTTRCDHKNTDQHTSSELLWCSEHEAEPPSVYVIITTETRHLDRPGQLGEACRYMQRLYGWGLCSGRESGCVDDELR